LFFNIVVVVVVRCNPALKEESGFCGCVAAA